MADIYPRRKREPSLDGDSRRKREPSLDKDSRRKRESWGRRAESLAALFLMAKGYKILARRVRTHAGEIDLIARHGDTLVFVEVKARATLDSGLFALHPAARQRIEAASRVLAPHYAGGCTTTRIDAVLVRPWALPVHMIAIWREQG